MFVDLVLCKHIDDLDGHIYLFYAPAFSGLKKGDSVIVDTKYGQKLAEVKDIETVDTKLPVYDFIVTAAGATKPLRKIIYRVINDELEYEEELIKEMGGNNE